MAHAAICGIITHGTCSTAIDVEVEGGIVRQVKFINGCPGNTRGIELLVQGMPAQEVIRRLKGVTCGHKPTSCPDQLARALEAAIEE